MRAYQAFLKKELLEGIRKYKSIILLAVAAICGVLSPLTAKFLPEIMSVLPLEGMELLIPEATVSDAYLQLYGNLSQLGMIALLLVYGGMLASEISKGTIVQLLARGMPKRAVIGAKFTAAAISWTLAVAVSGAVNYLLTLFFFGAHTAPNNLLILVNIWVFGLFLLALLLFAGSLVKGMMGSLLTGAGTIGILLLANFIPPVKPYNPVTMLSSYQILLGEQAGVSDTFPMLMITLGVTALLLCLSVWQFQKRSL